jgi:hypothetical protein
MHYQFFSEYNMAKAIEAFQFYTLMDKVFRLAGSVANAVEESWGTLAERQRDGKVKWKHS